MFIVTSIGTGSKETWRNWALFLILLIPLFLWFTTLPAAYSKATPEFVSALKAWYPYHYFPSFWGRSKWIRIIIYFIFFFVCFKAGFKRSRNNPEIKLFLLTLAVMWCAALIFGEFLPIRQIILLQFFRSDVIFLALGLIFASDYIVTYLESNSLEKICFGVLLSIIFIIKLPSTYALLVLMLLLGYHKPLFRSYQKFFMVIFIIMCFLGLFAYPDFLIRSIMVVSIFLGLILIFKPEKIVTIYKGRVLYIAALVFIIAPCFLSLPMPSNTERDFVALQKWVERNTPVESRFITPPYRSGFRVFSKRSTFVEWTDGAAMHWFPGFEREWTQRLSELAYDEDSIKLIKEVGKPGNKFYSSALECIYTSIPEQHILGLAKKNSINYFVKENNKERDMDFPVVYRNNAFSVYKIESN
jgi:hypothetical protein